MGYKKYLSAGYVLIYDNVEGDQFDRVPLAKNRVPGSPLFNLAQPVGMAYEDFFGYTEGGVRIDPGANVESESRQLSLSPTNYLLKDVKTVITTRLTFNGDYGVTDKASLPGQILPDQRWFSSNGELRERSILMVVYNYFDPNALTVYLIFRAVVFPAAIDLLPNHEDVEIKIGVLRGYEFGSRTCFRTDNDLFTRWKVSRYTPSQIVDKNGVPIVQKRTIPIPIEPLGILMFPSGS